MAYIVTHTNGDVYASVGEGSVNSKLGISLIGQNFTNYGQLIANNFLHLLENQANDTQPANPIEGQLWWNTTTKVISVFDGNRFKPLVSSSVSSTTPLYPLAGDQWWDTNEDRLKVYNGTTWAVIGPAYTKGQGIGGLFPKVISDVSGNNHVVLELTVNGNVVALINHDTAFNIAEQYGLTSIGKGITLVTGTVLTGSAVNSQQLGGTPASDFPTKSATSNVFTGNIVVTGSNGITANGSSVINNASLTGTPVAVSPSVGDNSTRVATTGFVTSTITKEAWIAPSLQNSWVNYSGSDEVAGYRKDSSGVVYIKGTIKKASGSTSPGELIFTLPAGYVPAGNYTFPQVCNGTFGAIKVAASGAVTVLNAVSVASLTINCSFSI